MSYIDGSLHRDIFFSKQKYIYLYLFSNTNAKDVKFYLWQRIEAQMVSNSCEIYFI